MFCSKCGTAHAEDDRFCSQCKTPLQNASDAVTSPASSTASTATMTRPVSAPPSTITLHLPAGEDLAPALMFWTGHVLALLGWVFAIILWAQSGKPLMADMPMVGDIGNPFKGIQIGLGFLSFITGHVLQIVFFWASELLKAVRAK